MTQPAQLTFYLATETRDAAYREVVKTLSARQKVVFELLQRGDRSNNEIASALGWPINRVTPRVFELRALNLVFPGETVNCRITGRKVQQWTVRRKGSQ